MREGLELARRAGHRQQVAWMESNLADYLVDMGRLEEAEPLSRTGLDEARRIGEPRRIAPRRCRRCPTSRSCVGDSWRRSTRSTSSASSPNRSLRGLRGGLGAPTERATRAGTWTSGQTQPASSSRARVGRRAAPRSGALSISSRRRRAPSFVSDGFGRRAKHGYSSPGFPRGAFRPPPFWSWVDALLEPDPRRARAQLGDAVSTFERLERRVELGRCFADVARVDRLLGMLAPALDARQVLHACGASLFLADVRDEEDSA